MKRSLKILLTIFAFSMFTVALLPSILNSTPASPAVGNWYQQFMPNLGGRQINDITFTDSVHGFAITNEVLDTSFVLRTTNGGDNWTINHFDNGICSYYSVQFLNTNTGFVSGYIYNGSNYRLLKTTNGGNTWVYVDHTSDIVAIDMHVLSVDTIWVVDSGSLTGGVYRTTNGGASWDHQINLGSGNPNKIYMFNQRIGFIARDGFYLRKSTDSGQTWNLVSGASGFTDIYFTDSLSGFKSNLDMKKTTDGGLTWSSQIIPNGGIILDNSITKFTHKSLDTIWAVGGTAFYGSGQFRGIIYRTINGGSNWQFQVPDTSIHSSTYFNIFFYNKNNGWAYWTSSGVHTTTGSDPVWYTGLIKISENIPKSYQLYQNFPNPFNPRTIIRYNIKAESYVKLTVFDITGKEVQVLQDGNQTAGRYETDFMGKFLSSGVYFYRLEVTNTKGKSVYYETRKMLLVK